MMLPGVFGFYGGAGSQKMVPMWIDADAIHFFHRHLQPSDQADHNTQPITAVYTS